MTNATSYALQAVAYLAAQKTQDKPVSSDVIAHARGISPRFLLKVLKPLVGARVLSSIKGPHGGYRLLRPASEINLLEVVEAIDGPIRGQAPQGRDSNGPINNKLLVICDQAAEAVRKHYEKIKLSELVGSRK
jgi:Rrf2 family protein